MLNMYQRRRPISVMPRTSRCLMAAVANMEKAIVTGVITIVTEAHPVLGRVVDHPEQDPDVTAHVQGVDVRLPVIVMGIEIEHATGIVPRDAVIASARTRTHVLDLVRTSRIKRVNRLSLRQKEMRRKLLQMVKQQEDNLTPREVFPQAFEEAVDFRNYRLA